MPVTFHHPVFDGTISNKIGKRLEIVGGSGHVLKNKHGHKGGCHAISSDGFPSNVDGTHVFVAQIDKTESAGMFIGWTSNPTSDSSTYAYPGYFIEGCSIWLYNGSLHPGHVRSVPPEVSAKAKEVVSILTISENGRKITAQWIVDGTEGAVHNVSGEFKNGGDQIFPVVVTCMLGQQVQTIPFAQLKSTSPKIEELKKELNNPVAPLPSSSSTNSEENEKLIQQLRQDLENAQKRLIDQKDRQIEELKQHHQNELKMKDRHTQQQLKMKDEQMNTKDTIITQKEAEVTSKNQEIQMKDKQLELERAEHQKTRNLLHQKTTEMKDQEIYFLKQYIQNNTQKESGQRRQRQDEENVKIKQERDD